MNVRRTLALALAGMTATAALSACGFNYPTDRVNNVTAGANFRDGTVEILNAAVVSRQADSGTFIATFVNDDDANAVTLQSMSGDDTAVGQVTLSQPLSIRANGLVNLATTRGIPLNGTFSLGQVVALAFQFDDGSTVTLDVPVVLDDGQWAGLDVSTPAPTASPSAPPSASPSASPSTPQSPSGSAS